MLFPLFAAAGDEESDVVAVYVKDLDVKDGFIDHDNGEYDDE